mgnify:CR=1 FL=1
MTLPAEAYAELKSWTVMCKILKAKGIDINEPEHNNITQAVREWGRTWLYHVLAREDVATQGVGRDMQRAANLMVTLMLQDQPELSNPVGFNFDHLTHEERDID